METTTEPTIQDRIQYAREIEQAIADNMPEGWKVSKGISDDPHMQADRINFKRKDGAEIFGWIDRYGDKGRIEFHGSYNDCKDIKGQVHYPSQYDRKGRKDSITVTKNATAHKMASEIVRRLLPEYLEMRGEMLARIQDQNNYASKCATLAKELADILGATVGNENTIFLSYDSVGGSATITTQGDNVRFELRSVPAELAKKIAKVLANA